MLYGIVLLALISVISFVIIQLPPGDWLSSYVATLRVQGTQVSDEMISELRVQYGLDLSPVEQYFKWMLGLLQGNMGFSFGYNRNVTELVLERLPITLLISFLGISATYLIAIPIGIISAVRQYSFIDYLATFIGFIGLSVPNFLLALLSSYLAYKFLGLSIGGLNSPEFMTQPMSWAKLWDTIVHLPLPILVIALAGAAPLVRVLRGTLLDELKKPYVVTARAKGVPMGRAILKYPVRVAMNPIISSAAWVLPGVISGQIIVSIVMNIPDIGPLLYQALISQDAYLAGSIVMILAALVIAGALISDVLLAMVDPRIRLEK